MAKKDRQGKYLTLQDVRVYYNEETGNVHLTSKDKDLQKFYNFNLTVNNGKSSEMALRDLLFNKGMLDHLIPFTFPSKYGDRPVAPDSEWDKIPLGINRAGKEFFWDILLKPTMLLSGATGLGKSVVEYGIINHCLKHPDRWKLSLIDPHRTEFYPLTNEYPNVQLETDRNQAFNMVTEIYDEMMRRYEIMESQGVNNFLDLSEKLTTHLLVIDEARHFLAPTGSLTEEGKANDMLAVKISDLISKIIRLGRAAGICMVISSYNVSDDFLTEDVRKQFGMRVHMGRGSALSSLMTLGNNKATTISSNRGRGYIQLGHKGEEVQFFWATLRDNT